ncbi:hypothetical protein SR870_10760 [Rhodopseudomonas palustris]|uniref:hypothetical protein n=1 Tax=Rhodopseudomonas palustris TaxID=1076 RepID=UPI002ACE3455|nr:hypothetical protein [Rhodopseudomonas palustris]WQH01715.1 hypothetical protein SR870_10760 [Rhodopseudomonas palustris]
MFDIAGWLCGENLLRAFGEQGAYTQRDYQVLDRVFEHKIVPARRDRIARGGAAMAIGMEKPRSAKSTRGLFP